jgi:hypothetical protein
LGAYSIPSETGLLLLFDFNNHCPLKAETITETSMNAIRAAEPPKNNLIMAGSINPRPEWWYDWLGLLGSARMVIA